MRRLFVALLVVFGMTASGCAMFESFAGWRPFKTIRPNTPADDEGSVFATPSPR